MPQYNQAMFMREFNETHREEFESELFKRDNEDMVKSIEQIVRSCERDKYFTAKILSFEAIYDYEDIYNTLRAHDEKRRKKNNKEPNSYDYINIKDTDMILCKVVWLIRHNGIERIEETGGTVEVANPEKILEVLIALPRFTKKYYFKLNGNYYTTAFQIIDGSTYNNYTASQSKVDTITFKTTFMPIRIFRCFRDMEEIGTGKKQIIRAIEYNANIFATTTNAMFYLLAHFGFYGVQQFLGIPCVGVSATPVENPDYYCFKRHNLYIYCWKDAFKNHIVQSFVSTLYAGINKECTINDIFDIRYWLITLGAGFKNASIDKGLFVLDSVDAIYDNITKDYLHLPMEDKENIYTIFRWLLREFSSLRAKENVDVTTKRIRISDYIAAIYAEKISPAIHRISDQGRRITLKKVEQAIYTNPMLIMKELSGQSNLIAYRDLVNDNDATIALKYTYKGISGLGENNASVQPVYRYIDPSHVGILDLDASTNSDPGLSGIICPMTKLYNKSFSEYEEPNTWDEQWNEIYNQYMDSRISPIKFTEPPIPFDYYSLRNEVVEEELEINRIKCPIKNIDDPEVLYTCSAQQIEKEKDKPIHSLFNVTDNVTQFLN